MKYFLGIDPGKKGAIALINENEEIIFKHLMPMIRNEYDLFEIQKLLLTSINSYSSGKDRLYIFVEQIQDRPMNSGKVNKSLGVQEGVLHTILKLNKISFEIVNPKKWQKEIFQGNESKDTKVASANFCLRKYPNEEWKASSRCKNIHDGLTDGTCIALYGKRKIMK